jgi:cGMP-dependent 3',5'-cyclic phosphodiesterase
MEKTMGSSPVESMDRDKAYIPSLQIQFLDNIVIPLYGCVIVLSPRFTHVNVHHNNVH